MSAGFFDHAQPGESALGTSDSLNRTRLPQTSELSLSDGAYKKLRHEIILGLFRPNERIVESELSERYGISRTPVRDALKRLTNEGLVDSGRRGWVIHEFSGSEVKDIYETRAAIEGFAMGLVALRATDAQLREMEELLEAERRDLYHAHTRTVESNAEFHHAVVAACGNARLIRLVELNSNFYFSKGILPLYSADELQKSLEGHYQLMAALHRRDPAAAEQAIRGHLLDSLAVILRTKR